MEGYFLQQQQLGVGIPKPAQISEAVGHDSEGDRKYGRNGAGPGSDVQGGGAVGSIIWKRDLGGDWGDYQGPDGVTPLVSAKDNGDDREMRGRRRVGVPIGKGGDGSRGDPPHRGVHQEAEGDYILDCVLSPCICTVHRGIEDARDKLVGVVVGSRRGK